MEELSDFAFADITQWEQQVLEDLNLTDITQLIEHPLYDNLTQPPYVDFTSNNQRGLIHGYRNCSNYSGEKWEGARRWVQIERITSKDPDESNQRSLEALSGGADGVILDIRDRMEFQNLLAGISLPDCYLGITTSLKNSQHLNVFLSSGESTIKGFIAVDDLLQHLTGETDEIVHLFECFDQCRNLVLSEAPEKTGSLLEIALLLNQAVYVINTLLDSGVSAEIILRNIQFNLQVGDSYLWEICRLRCLRSLFHIVASQYDAAVSPQAISIHAITSDPGHFSDSESTEETRIETLRLISNTTQAMSAILGGCNILTVDPAKTAGTTSTDFNRISRNVSHILRAESFLHKVADPVAGSYYLEELTNNMMKAVWARFQELQKAGGYLKSTLDEA